MLQCHNKGSRTPMASTFEFANLLCIPHCKLKRKFGSRSQTCNVSLHHCNPSQIQMLGVLSTIETNDTHWTGKRKCKRKGLVCSDPNSIT